jgi:2'-deoxynucleoside 5'-phosphate N-hydrolase
MNLYFACSITGGRDFEPVYQAITAALLADGHSVPTAHLAESRVKSLEASISPGEVYKRDTTWIRGCDALIAEVSTPSHGVGYEIAFALNIGKPVLCIHQADRPISKMLSGNDAPYIQVKAYTNSEHAIRIIRDYLGRTRSS